MKTYLQPVLKILLIGLIVTKISASVFLLSGFDTVSQLFYISQLAHAQDEKPEDLKNAEAPQAETVAPEPEKESAATTETKIILESLEKKRRFLQQEENRIAEEKKQLETLKEEMEEKVVTLTKIHQKIEQKLKKIEQKETQKERKKREVKERKIKQLLKIYTSMKPKDVGAIIDKLEFQDALTIFLRMKGDQAAKILTYINPERAVKISEQLINEKNRNQAK